LPKASGIEDKIKLNKGRRYLLPGGSERFLVDDEFLINWTNRVGGFLAESIKTTNFQNLRCMTTWIARKNDSRFMKCCK